METRVVSKAWGDIWRPAAPAPAATREPRVSAARAIPRVVAGIPAILGLVGAGTWMWVSLSDRLESLKVLEPLFYLDLSPLLNAFLYAGAGLCLFLFLVLFVMFVAWLEFSKVD